MPDLGAQPWRTVFTIKKQGQGAQKRTNSKNQKTNSWKIPPRGARMVLLEIPSSAGLNSGKYDLTIAIDAQLSKYKQQQTIHLTKAKPLNVDTLQKDNQKLEALWMQSTTNGFDLYLNNGTITYHLHFLFV